jgi:hypothetical protein
MPHDITDIANAYLVQTTSSSRDSSRLFASLDNFQGFYEESQLASTINRQLQITLKSATTPITRMLPLGLGNLPIAKGRSRRMKQLTILLAFREYLQRVSVRRYTISTMAVQI